MLETLEDRKNNLINYLNAVNVNESWKQKLTDEKSLGITTQVYLFYPELFWSVFAENDSREADEEVLNKLCIAGYLYFGSILLQDKILDNRTISNYENVLQISWMQEESIRILHSIFPADSSFWDLWIERRNEYFSSAAMQQQHVPLTLPEYELLADRKSAFGKVAIDCCFMLFKNDINRDIHNKLIQSHAFFSMGLQVLDDIEDIDEDFKTHQLNIVLQWAKNRMPEQKDGIVASVQEIKKFVYVSGIYGSLLDLACDYLQKALSIIKDIPKTEKWKGCIFYKLRKASQRKQIFTIYTKELYVKTHYSTQKLYEIESVSPASCLAKALEFVFAQQDKAGSWIDMVTNAGFSNVWTTGFVLSHVAACQGYTEAKEKATGFLLENKIPTSLWGYSQKWELADADSTTNVLTALFLTNKLHDNTLVDQWLNDFTTDKGFSTYKTTRPLQKALPEFKDFSGWTQAHDCVSALALHFLSMLPEKTSNEQYAKLKYTLFNNLNSGWLWDGYWWTSPIYTSSLFVRAVLTKEGDEQRKSVDKIIDGILRMSNANGSFGTAFDPESAFYTAQVLDMLCSTPASYAIYKKEADASAHWLQQQQLTDGSFYASHILRVPDPSILEPANIKNWSTDTGVPVNVVKKDIMRLYTAAVVCSAMMKYNKCLT